MVKDPSYPQVCVPTISLGRWANLFGMNMRAMCRSLLAFVRRSNKQLPLADIAFVQMVFGLVSLHSFIVNSFGTLLAAFCVTRVVYSELNDPCMLFLSFLFADRHPDQHVLLHLSSSTPLYSS